jgi:hypothetical protein
VIKSTISLNSSHPSYRMLRRKMLKAAKLAAFMSFDKQNGHYPTG